MSGGLTSCTSHTSGVAWLSKCKEHLLAPLSFLVVVFLLKLHGLGHLPKEKRVPEQNECLGQGNQVKGIIRALVTNRSLLAAVGRAENKALGLETLPTTELR